MNKKHWSLLTSYLVSYCGVAIVACAIIGIFMFNASYRSMRASASANIQERLRIALEDFDNQREAMHTVSLYVSNQLVFKPHYFGKNKVLEIELLEALASYEGYVQVASEFFLYYHGMDIVFRSAGNTTDKSVFLGQMKLRAEQLDDMEGARILREGNSIYALFPVYPYGRSSVEQGSAVLGFVIQPSMLFARLELVSGGMNGHVLLDVNGTRMLDAFEEKPTGKTVALSADLEDLHLSLVVDADTLFPHAEWMNYLNVSLFVLCFLLLLALASGLGYSRYAPIQQVFRKYAPDKRARIMDMGELDELLRASREQSMQYLLRIQAQMSMLRRQFLGRLLTGEYTEDLESRLKAADTRLYSCFGIVRLLSKRKLPEHLWEHIEQLSDENCGVYCISGERENCLHVFISAEKEESVTNVREMLENLLDFGDPRGAVEVCQSPVYRDLSETHLMYRSLLNRKSHGEAAFENCESIDEILAAMEEGDPGKAKNLFRKFAQKLAEETVGEADLRYRLLDAATDLLRATREQAGGRLQGCVEALLDAENSAMMMERMEKIITQTAQAYSEEQKEENTGLAGKMLPYIAEHCAEYDMSLERVGEHFGISSGHVSRIVKRETGESYKEYVTALRVDRAKQLLAEENMRVADVCPLVGYANISHFIKVFKAQTGITPAKYREITRAEAFCEASETRRMESL